MNTGGGLFAFKDQILLENPSHVIIVHCNICSNFPLARMLEFHKSHGQIATFMATNVSPETSTEFGCIIEDKKTHEVLHFAEKPENFVSTLVNCGVYIFTKDLYTKFSHLSDRLEKAKKRQLRQSTNAFVQKMDKKLKMSDFISLEKDVLIPLADTKLAYIYQVEKEDFWVPVHTLDEAINCNLLYLDFYKSKHSPIVYVPTGKEDFEVIGNVYIHPTANIRAGSKIGPNASIGAYAKVGPGARIQHAIILENVEINAHSCLMYCIIGWNSIVGAWSRIEGTPKALKSRQNDRITVFGVGVIVDQELVVRNCIVLPYKKIVQSCYNEVLL